MNVQTDPDVVCLSHLRWNFVFQRPQHLMVRFARSRRVFFIEEPVFDADAPRLEIAAEDVSIVTPHLPERHRRHASGTIKRLLADLFDQRRVSHPLLWLYTPIAWPLVSDTPAAAVVYDCMDELSGFAGASPQLRARERELMAHADVMFTGGYSLYEAKQGLHANVHPMPSSVDVPHFRRARTMRDEPADQQPLPRPRIGFCGVIDERMNLDLLGSVARRRPEWQFVMIGPVVKIDQSVLPRLPNIHYLGMRAYDDLPAYFSGWDVAILPFAHNSATRYISPTKTPEYLAAGCPVVSTSIRDVVRPYGDADMVAIADTPDAFEEAIVQALGPWGGEAVQRAERVLKTMSWDHTWAAMHRLVSAAEHRRAARPSSEPPSDVATALA